MDRPNAERVYVIDGDLFDDLDGFFRVASDALMDVDWKVGNLDGFNDILRGGFGRPTEGGYTLLWRNAARSSRVLGHDETARWLALMSERCHPTNRESVVARLKRAEDGEGETLFNIILEIIFHHCKGGAEEEDLVCFVMES